ncbi:hypothetical protein B0H21DRAFT_732342 [Amylocystis lapponica]|nr:hypothetical protein B0H21DRAFT_732342 [Amylocystis lapponica]
MPTKRAAASCQVCSASESKYTCAQCLIHYCSIPCYKQHKAISCASAQAHTDVPARSAIETDQDAPPAAATLKDEEDSETPLSAPPPLRPLTSLRWPYIPDESAYPDPLKRDDPKALTLPQYESIATSPAVRRALAAHPRLPALLRSLDQLRGPDREDALQRALGVVPAGAAPPEDDTLALRGLAEAVEAAVRGGKQDVLGLDWGQ